MPEANSASILSRPPTQYPGIAPALAPKPKFLNRLCQQNLAEGWSRVQVPHALDRKYPNAAADMRCQWVFPQESRWRNRETGGQGRHHVHESIVQKAVKEAVAQADVVKHVSCQTFRHSFTTYLLQGGHDIRTIQELLGHKDVCTTEPVPERPVYGRLRRPNTRLGQTGLLPAARPQPRWAF